MENHVYTYDEIMLNFKLLAEKIIKYTIANIPPDGGPDKTEWHYVHFLELPECMNKYDAANIIRVYIAGTQSETHAVEFGDKFKVALYKDSVEIKMNLTLAELAKHYEVCIFTTMKKLLPEWLKTQIGLPESQTQSEVLPTGFTL